MVRHQLEDAVRPYLASARARSTTRRIAPADTMTGRYLTGGGLCGRAASTDWLDTRVIRVEQS
jgi:hypothetical protein